MACPHLKAQDVRTPDGSERLESSVAPNYKQIPTPSSNYCLTTHLGVQESCCGGWMAHRRDIVAAE